MTLEEAIEILDRIAAQDEECGRPECVEAEKLGIEALRAVKDARANNYYTPIQPLPGETGE